jgi:hypothetical protein
MLSGEQRSAVIQFSASEATHICEYLRTPDTVKPEVTSPMIMVEQLEE